MSKLVTSHTDLNIYQLLHPKGYDSHSVYMKEIILQPYQTIPKYYIYSANITSLICHYQMGAGKTITAVFAMLYYLDLYKMFIFNNRFIPKNNSNKISKLKVKKNVWVTGSWVTSSAFASELLRPELHFFPEEQLNTLNELLTSPIYEQREEGKTLKNKLLKQIEKYVYFLGYQSLFNQLFPNIKMEKFNQDASALINEYEAGRIEISQEFISKIQNSIIIIDEMQRLYSVLGMNSYGFAVMMISKIAKQYNIKMVYLTGTMINSSLYEIVDILNIVRTEKELLRKEDYTEQVNILDDIVSPTLKKDKIDETINMFYKNFIYYDPNGNVEKNKVELVNKQTIEKHNKLFFAYTTNDTYKYLLYEQREFLPEEIHVGNSFINTTDSSQPIILYSVEVEGFQKEEYKKYIQKASQMSTSEIELEDENESTVLIQDGYIPMKDSLKYGIIENNEVFIGKFLKLENIRKFSALGYELCKLCLENTWNNEKTIVYHYKLRNFGIYQYAAILSSNGFIKTNESPKNDSLCKFCRKTYESHAYDLETRLKNKVCNHFIAMRYDILTGSISQQERETLLNTYNSPLNLYGNNISVVFVSDVAYSGVSFLNTNNIVILSRMSNISKWKQICARIIRTRSHSLLPKEKQYAKIYTMIINYPNELKEFPKLNKYTVGERYYKIHEVLNEDVEKYTKKLANNCIGKMLLETPEIYKPDEKENVILNNLFINDFINEMKLIINRIHFNNNTAIWKYSNLLKRIKNSNMATTFLDLQTIPTSLLENIMLDQKLVSSFKFINDTTNTKYAVINGNNNDDLVLNKLTSFPFQKIYSINTSGRSLKLLISSLEKEKSELNKINILRKILKFINRKYEILSNIPIFWETIFAIGDEYYDDDEQNFFVNHSRNNRNKNKMTGMYFGEYIIKRDGYSKQINYSFPELHNWKDIPYLFKITCLVITESSPFYLHVNIIKHNDKDNVDMRKVNKGVVCTSFDNIENLKKYFPSIKKDFNKKTWCSEFLYVICEMQSKNDVKAVMSPFEK